VVVVYEKEGRRNREENKGNREREKAKWKKQREYMYGVATKESEEDKTYMPSMLGMVLNGLACNRM
jgi:hypothetical protein